MDEDYKKFVKMMEEDWERVLREIMEDKPNGNLKESDRCTQDGKEKME